MTSDRTIFLLFEQLVDLPADAQLEALEKACAGDQELFDRVRNMLEADREAPDILNASLEELTPIVPDSAKDNDDGRVDVYRLLRKIGEGGMGVVYEAVRDDGQFKKQVALKRIKRGMDTEEIVRRFEHERQILASLEHPNIARLIDGGINDDRPYFVMEFVEGKPITTYADSHKLGINARLHLFTDVCNAVQHAHQRLVVHRDLKPSNILVTDAGEVKLLDFGIAKLLSTEAIAATALPALETQTGRRILTPAYASPEQLAGTPVTTATDVYALGLVLYELLTGQYPFDKHDTNPSTRTEARIAKPSTAVARSTTPASASAKEISQARNSTTERLQRRLRGDLDTIVLKALQPEPARRYASASLFLEDIERHLAGLPVAAQPDTLSYRARKFIGRHRVGVSMAVVVMLMLVGFAVAMGYQQAQTALERDTAEEVAAFLESMFDASNPFAEERLDTLRVEALLQRGASQLDALSEQPLVQARMQHIIGRVNSRLGLNNQARPLLQQALTTRQQYLDGAAEEVAETQIELGDVHYALGEYGPADSLFGEALQSRLVLFQHNDPLVAEAMSKQGLALHAIGELDEAARLFSKALQIQQATLGESSIQVATTMSTLASLIEDQGDFAASESLHVASLNIRKTIYDANHPGVATGLKNLAIFLRNRQRYADAEPLLREAIAIDRATLNENHPNLITDLNILASVLRRTGDYEAAEAIFEEVLDRRRRLLGTDHPDVSITLDSYARVLKEKGDFSRAEALQREAIAIARKVYGDEHMSIAITTGSLASILRAAGEPARALPAYQEALALYEKLFSVDHPNVAVLRSNTAGCLTELGRYQEAEALLLKSYSVLETTQGRNHRLTQSTIRYLVTLYEAWQKPAESNRYSALIIKQ